MQERGGADRAPADAWSSSNSRAREASLRTTALRPKEASPLADDRLAARGQSPSQSGRLTAHYLHGMRAPFLDVAGGIAHLLGRRRADQHVQAERRQLTPAGELQRGP